jgi:hypothetical protein
MGKDARASVYIGMATWKDILAGMTRERSLERARSVIAQGTVYKLGKGGFKPESSLWSQGKTADCSGFSAWALGIPREFPPGSRHWLQTTTYWEGGGFPGAVPFRQQPLAQAIPGDLLVYPDSGGRQGHIAIVTATDAQGPKLIVHCSSGNFRNTGDAIRETPPTVFNINPQTRLMRVEFDVLRAIAGLIAPSDDELPQPLGGLRSLTLSHDPSLRLVAAGMLELEVTDERMGGIPALQTALRSLVTVPQTYASAPAALTAGEGVFDSATADALAAFQEQMSLAPTRVLDAATLRALDSALIGSTESARPTSLRAPRALAFEDAEAAPLSVATRQEGSRFFASVGGGPEFFVGRRVRFGALFGLMNTSVPGGAAYAARDHLAQVGHWAHLLEPTAMCEGEGFFDRLNTYDRARFTFGFLQFAAHNPESDFVKFFRRLLALPLAPAYFPDLKLIDGRITLIGDGRTTELETASSTELLMDYLNPDSDEVQEREVVNCAKFVHWCANDPGHRAAQVEIGVKEIKKAMTVNHGRYGLDGRTDVTGLLIFDIHHQGRASVATVRAALARATTEESAWEELLAIGLPKFEERLATLRAHVMSKVSAGILGQRRYVAATNDFV